MGDLLKYVTELKADGRITEREQGSKLLANWFDAVNSAGQESRPRTIADNSPACRKERRPSKKNKP